MISYRKTVGLMSALMFILGAPVAGATPIVFTYGGTCLDGPRDEDRILDCGNVGLEHGDPVSGRIEIDAFALDDFILTGQEIRDFGSFDFAFGDVEFDDGDSFISGVLALDASYNIIGGLFNINQFFNAANTLSFAEDGAGLWNVRVGLGRRARFAGGIGQYTTNLAISEPGTLALLGMGLLALGSAGRRRRR